MKGSITMAQKYFIPQHHIITILNHYGGLEKYKLNNHIREKEYSRIFYCEKTDYHKWLTIAKVEDKIMVTLTNDVGLIIQRDYWYIYNEECLLQSEEIIKI
jgi:hypothetical protein